MIPRNRPNYNHKELLSLFRHTHKDRNTVHELCTAEAKKVLNFNYVLFSAYGRAAIKTVLEAVGVVGRKIILPAYTCRVVADSIVLSNNVPCFVDIDLKRFTMSPGIKEFIDDKTKAIIPALLYGNSYDMDETVVQNESLLLIEDACMAFGNPSLRSYHRKNSVAVYSFNIGKPLCTVHGSLIGTNDRRIYRKLSAHIDKNRGENEWSDSLEVVTKFFILLFLFNSGAYGLVYHLKNGRLKRFAEDTSEAMISPGTYMDKDMPKCGKAIFLSQMDKHKSLLENRRRLFIEYSKRLRSIPGLKLPEYFDGSSLSHYTILAERRDELKKRLLQQGVETVPAYHYALHELDGFKRFNRFGPLKNASLAARKSLCLPFYDRLTSDQLNNISGIIKRFYDDTERL